MALSVLNNIPALAARNNLAITQSNLQTTLFRLSSGQRINSGADDAAGLAIADGLRGNITALQQSAQNANTGVGKLQVADGALSQVTTLLNRAVTLATESSTGTVTPAQQTALDTEYSSIKSEINRIGTDFNGSSVFTSGTTSIFLSDANSQSSIGVSVGALSTATLALAATNLTGTNAPGALSAISAAIASVASNRGAVGATVNRLNSAVNVINNQVQNLTSAEDGIRSADIASEVGNLSKYQILNQTGISALAQANQSQQSVLKLLQ